MTQKNKPATGTNGAGSTAEKSALLHDKGTVNPDTMPHNAGSKNGRQGTEKQPDSKADKGNAEALITRIDNYLKPRYTFRSNMVKNAIEFQRKGETTWADVDERQALRIEAELLRKGFKSIGRTLHVLLANAPEYDPVLDYLKRLPAWDGKTDHIGHLAGYVLVSPERRAWFDLMFKKHLVRILACALGYIPFNKQCFVFVSGQNDGKTTFLRFIAPPEWQEYYTEDIDFDNKDGLITLARNLFINLDELRNLSRQDINKVKSFLTKDHIKARMPFDRRETKLRRRASFWGSTNNAEFLTDETGNVRWLVFEILGIQHDNGGPEGYGANVNINDVYAQAYALLQSDFKYQLSREEIEQSEAYNSAHTVKPPEYELILKYYDPCADQSQFKTATDIKQHLEIVSSQKLSPVNIGKALRMLGYTRHAKKIHSRTLYGYWIKDTGEKDWTNAQDGELEDAPF